MVWLLWRDKLTVMTALAVPESPSTNVMSLIAKLGIGAGMDAHLLASIASVPLLPLAAARSIAPSLLKSPTARWDGEPPVRKLVGAPKVPPPELRRIDRF